MRELWRDSFIPGYEVSSIGRVRNVKSGKIISQWGKIYKMVGVSSNGWKGSILVHKMVALAWIGPRPLGKTINHKDGVRFNNVVWNLEYLTPSENQLHAKKLGTGAVGERVTAFVKLTSKEVFEIKRKYVNKRGIFTKLGREYKVGHGTIAAIIYGRSWKHI